MSDDDRITITADGATLHAQEKVSTGDYETFTASCSLDVAIEGADIDAGIPKPLRARLLSIQRDLQRDVEQAAEQRLAERDFETWAVQDHRRGE